MRILKNIKRMIATVLSVTTCLTPGLAVSAEGGKNKAITIQMGPSSINQLPLVYNDDYFDKSAFEYNESLATASLALELSGFAYRSYRSEDDYSDQAKNVKQALRELDFGDIQENDGYKQKTTADSIGVVAANKKIKSNNEDYTLIPVVIRGGGYENEWGGNAKVGKSGDHEGFDAAATKAKEFVDNYIRDKQIKGKVKLWIVGYSRGGATASLLGVKFNNDFTPILNALNKENENSSSKDYYNSYVSKERVRTLQKYGREIEINPNDLYVYTFEAPMGMNRVNGSGLKEYKGNIPYSESEKSDKAIYANIHNTINDDDFVTKVAPGDWGFVRPGVDHKLLEGREDRDVKNMEEILNSFLINKKYPGSVKYVGKTLLEKPKGWLLKIFNYVFGYKDFSSLSDGIISMFNSSLRRARNGDSYENWDMNNREYYVFKYQKIISKLAVSVMSNMSEFESAKMDILINSKDDVKKLIKALKYNTNNISEPFNKIMDKFSSKMHITFDKGEREALVNLLKGADQYSSLPLLSYCLFNDPKVFKMHDPELHLATLISKDKNKQLYVDQIQMINNANIPKQVEESKRGSVDDFKADEWLDEFAEELIQDEKKDKEEDKKVEFLDDFVQLEKENGEEDKEEDKKVEFLDDFVDVEKECSKYGLNKAVEFVKQQQKEDEVSKPKGILNSVFSGGVTLVKAGGQLVKTGGKMVKTGGRLITTPISESKNIFSTAKNWYGYMWSKLK